MNEYPDWLTEFLRMKYRFCLGWNILKLWWGAGEAHVVVIVSDTQDGYTYNKVECLTIAKPIQPYVIEPLTTSISF